MEFLKELLRLAFFGDYKTEEDRPSLRDSFVVMDYHVAFKCTSCKYHSSNVYLPCAVHSLPEDRTEDCPDWESRYDR